MNLCTWKIYTNPESCWAIREISEVLVVEVGYDNPPSTDSQEKFAGLLRNKKLQQLRAGILIKAEPSGPRTSNETQHGQ